MKIAVLGTGMVGRSHAEKHLQLGHEIFVGTRDVAQTLARTETDAMGNTAFADWLKRHAGVKLLSYADAAKQAEVVINCTAGMHSLEALERAGRDNLRGKILMDISNPLDFSKGMPPFLSVCNINSLGEQIQDKFPETKVVKTLNTVNAYLQVNPTLLPGDHDVFISGNDSEAKKTVIGYITSWYGWKSIIDLGDITTARGTEMYLPLWLRLFAKFQKPQFNLKIVVKP